MTVLNCNRSEKPPAEQNTSGKETVLIVEDDEAVRKLAEQILKEAGYKALTAACGTLIES
jgi:response regulator RpfG family c-di-GMP phosphodiesterase